MRRISRFGNYALPIIVTVTLAATSFGDDYALVVGVNSCPDYVDNQGKAYLTLNGAEADARAFADLLRQQYRFPEKNIVVLIGGAAKYETIKKEFASFGHKLGENDQFVFYFAGHGTQVPDRRPYDDPRGDEPDGKDEALCPADATTIDENGTPNSIASKLVVDDRLAEWLRDLNAKRVAVVLDCCHAGTGIKGDDQDKILDRSLPMVPLKSGPLPRKRADKSKDSWHDLQPIGKGTSKTVVALYACGPEQPAIERSFRDLKGDVRGQFTKLLIDYLRNGDANASSKQISEHVKNDIQKLVAQKQAQQRTGEPLPEAWQRARDQNPMFESDEGDAAALIVPAK